VQLKSELSLNYCLLIVIRQSLAQRENIKCCLLFLTDLNIPYLQVVITAKSAGNIIIVAVCITVCNAVRTITLHADIDNAQSDFLSRRC
jgi:hypothetical protein